MKLIYKKGCLYVFDNNLDKEKINKIKRVMSYYDIKDVVIKSEDEIKFNI